MQAAALVPAATKIAVDARANAAAARKATHDAESRIVRASRSRAELGSAAPLAAELEAFGSEWGAAHIAEAAIPAHLCISGKPGRDAAT
jgi:hypothetical protein